MSLDVVILAAGQGSRMRSRLPKVLHPLAGRPMLQRVVDAARTLGDARLHVVIGHGAKRIETAFEGQGLDFVVQSEQLGTGHAVAQALASLGDGPVLVLYGDVPLIRGETLERLIEGLDHDRLNLLTVELADPSGYGRIIRDESGRISSIVEHKDASLEQRRVRECNTGILATTGALLKRWLPRLSSANAQGEYYLTDIVAMARFEGIEIDAAQPEHVQEVAGVNDRTQLAALERWLQREQAERVMAEGATLSDPSRFELRGSLEVGFDVSIDVGCVFEGEVSLAENVSVGPYCVIRDARIGPGTRIEAHSVIDGAEIEGDSQIGPFARLRPGTVLARGVRIGNFVETKQARIGADSKVNHLSYIGDARIGRDTNVGAGTITCNYDGVNKHRTEIGDEVFVGSNTALVAPITIGDRVTIAAGSTLTQAVEHDRLVVARSRQVEKSGWQRPKKG